MGFIKWNCTAIGFQTFPVVLIYDFYFKEYNYLLEMFVLVLTCLYHSHDGDSDHHNGSHRGDSGHAIAGGPNLQK